MQKPERSLINYLFSTDSVAHNQWGTEPAPVVKRLLKEPARAPSLPFQKIFLEKDNDTSRVPNYLNSLQELERERQILIQDIQEVLYWS